MVNTPIPHSLKSEAKKAAKILREFTMPNSKTGPDKLIPVGILTKARGLAILTVFKAGFLLTARGGSGIVIAKLRDEVDYSKGWSAPSAIGLAGLGGGFEIGMEVTDFVIILNTQAAVDAFSKGGNLTLGGNFTIAVGPLGRNIEGDVAVRSPAAIYTYSKTKGIFAGISVEGSALIERKDANRKFYGSNIRAYEILAGDVDPPAECEALYQVMKEHQELAARAALRLAKQEASKFCSKRLTPALPSLGKKMWNKDKSEPSATTETSSTDAPLARKGSTSRGASNRAVTSDPYVRPKESYTAAHKLTSSTASSKSKSSKISKNHSSPSFAGTASLTSGKGPPVHTIAVAKFVYQAQLPCDLSLSPGDEIHVLTRTDCEEDWWEGRIAGRVGIFPANYVRLM